MAHYALIAPPLAGHWAPMAALAGALIDRGHRASFASLPGAEALLTDHRIGFLPISGGAPDLVAAMTDRLCGQHGLAGLPTIIADMRHRFALLCAGLPAALTTAGIDALAVDQLEPAGGLVAQHLRLPYLSVANALLINRDPAVPPPFTDWSFRDSPAGRWRNRGGYRVNDLLLRGVSADIARQARAWGLSAARMEDCLSPTAQISQTVAGFDFPRLIADPTLHQLGPFRALRPSPPPVELPPGHGPLLFASLGTLQGGRADIFTAIATAADQLGARLIIAHGGRLPAEAIAALPGSPMVHAFVDQTALLPHVDAVVGHGGLNTTMDTLAAGRPLVAIPFAFEQGAIAARLVHSGAGLCVPPSLYGSSGLRLTNRLTAAISAVLTTPTFTSAAQRLATEIAAAGGLPAAADIAETILTDQRVSSAA